MDPLGADLVAGVGIPREDAYTNSTSVEWGGWCVFGVM